MSWKQRAARGRGQARELAKIALRRVLYKRNLDLVRSPYPVRLGNALNWLGIRTVMDVGANVGQYATAIRAAGFAGRIVSCEPLQDAYDALSRRAGADPSWTALHTAVGDRPGSTEINVSANSYSSSVLVMTRAHLDAAPGSQIVGVEQSDMTTVADLVREHGIEPETCLLKVDTQGYESQVLEGAGGVLDRFAAIQLELSFVPLYAGQALFDELTGKLGAMGFVLYGLDAGIADPVSGRILQCDGLFVRADLIDGRAG